MKFKNTTNIRYMAYQKVISAKEKNKTLELSLK